MDLSEGLKCGQSKGLGDLVQKFIHGFGGGRTAAAVAWENGLEAIV